MFNDSTEIEKPLLDLLMRFGQARSHYYPNMPFCRLQSDGVWQLTNIEGSLKMKISSGVNGHQRVEKLFWDFEVKNILLPDIKEDYLHDRFVEWHLWEVFRK